MEGVKSATDKLRHFARNRAAEIKEEENVTLSE
jgi:hypothetical protein